MGKEHLGLMIDHAIGDEKRPVADRRDEIIKLVKSEYRPENDVRSTLLWSISAVLAFGFIFVGVFSLMNVKTDAAMLSAFIILQCSWIGILLTVIAHNTLRRG